MPLFAVQYTYAADSESVRDIHRPAHRKFLNSLTSPVALLASGAWSAGPAGALLIFSGPTGQHIAAALAADPFSANGLITHVDIREWNLTGGPWAP